jgi:hypothetical protein
VSLGSLGAMSHGICDAMNSAADLPEEPFPWGPATVHKFQTSVSNAH